MSLTELIITDDFKFSDEANAIQGGNINAIQEGGVSKCGPGQTLRVAYDRKSHTKKGFMRSDGTEIPASRVPAVHVPATCVPKKGEGKPKILPKPSGKLHLSKYGYSTKKSSGDRQKALREATFDLKAPLEILRHLNLIANYMSWNPKTQAKLRKDVEYMSKLYKGFKKSHSKGGSKGGSKKN